MTISTKGRYALRFLIDIAEQEGKSFVPLKDIALRQGISLKYLEKMATELTKAGFVEGVHGRGGGYRLTKSPESYIIGDVLRVVEGDLAPVACLKEGATSCERADKCQTYPMWKEFYRMVNDFFNGITLSDIMKSDITKNN